MFNSSGSSYLLSIMLQQQLKKKMETTRDQFVEALYQKGLAIAEIEFLKVRNFLVWHLVIFD